MRKFFFISALLFFSVGITAQVLFTAEASRYKVAVGETFSVTFKVNSNASNFDYPDFQGFQVVSGPMTGMNTSIINGKMSQERTAEFDLIALKEGTFKIGPAKLNTDGKVYQTKPLTIKVVKESNRPTNSLEAKAAELAKVKILTNKKTVYVGEPISTRYTLLLKTNVSQFNLLEEPDYQGFIKNDIELKGYESKKEMIDGERINTIDIAQFVLVPQQAGKIKPGTLRLRLPTNVPTGRRDWFGQPEMRTVNQVSTSGFPTINVKPLPDGKPAGFSGGVGKYKLYVNLSRNEVQADESVTLTVEISGDGNLQLAELPKPVLPNSIESYEPKYKENVRVKTSGISGYKRHEYLLLPRFKGIYKIPPIKFSYFDPNKEEYVMVTSEEFEINVTTGPEAKNVPGTTNPVNTDKSAVNALGSDILFIHTTPSTFETDRKSFFSSRWHIIALGAMFLLLLGGFAYFRFKQSYRPDQVAQARRKAANQALKQIKASKAHIQANDVQSFYAALTSAVQGFYRDRFHVPISKFNEELAVDLIVKKGGAEELANDLSHILKQADMARFAPVTQANMEEDYERTLQLINNLDQLS